MSLKVLTLRDKGTIESFFGASRYELSAYSFAALYVWRSLYEISWDTIEGSLCIFLSDPLGCFMYCPPLSGKHRQKALQQSFAIMDSRNKNKAVSRVENIEPCDLDWYRKAGYAVVEKFPEYVYDRDELSRLRGNKYKSKRANLNYFTGHYGYRFEGYTDAARQECVALYRSWAESKKEQDNVYRGMLKDSFAALQVLLESWRELGVMGRVVRVEESLKAFTFGFKLNDTTACIMYEIADTSVKGLSQYVFKAMCDEWPGVTFINAMDDSGLANLARVKRSYHPVRLARSYIAGRGENE